MFGRVHFRYGITVDMSTSPNESDVSQRFILKDRI